MNKRKKKIIIWISGILMVIIIGALVALPFIVMNPMLNVHVDFKRTWTAEEYGLEAKHFFVKTEDGLNISAYEVEVDTPKVVVICLSGIHNPSATAYFGHARLFKEQNYATILFDMRAHGESDGNRICLGYKEHLDTKAIVEYIKEKPLYDNVPIVVMGVSMGAATAINSIGQISEIDGLISLSAYSSWEDVFSEGLGEFVPKVFEKIEEPFIYLSTFIKYGSKSAIRPKTEIKKLGNRPALLMHSTEDTEVLYSNFERLVTCAPSHIETFTKEGNFHFITEDEDFFKPEKDKEYSEILLQFIHNNFVAKR